MPPGSAARTRNASSRSSAAPATGSAAGTAWSAGAADQFITEDLKGGGLPEVIDKGEPAILVCHWPGIYFNGEEVGFKIFQEVVRRMHARYDHLIWMKLGEIARYWAAKELTRISRQGNRVVLNAALCRAAIHGPLEGRRTAAAEILCEWGDIHAGRDAKPCVSTERRLVSTDGDDLTICFDLPKGQSVVEV